MTPLNETPKEILASAEQITASPEMPDSRRLELTDQLTVEAWVRADDDRLEGMQALVSKWRPPDAMDRFAAHDAAGTDGLNSTGYCGDNTNIQDGAVLHTDPGIPLDIGQNVTIGHMAMLHGCTIGDNTLVGIKAVVLNGAKIGSNCLIGANALVTEGKEIPDGSLVLGIPGKVVRELTDEKIAGLKESADHYVQNGRRYHEHLEEQTWGLILVLASPLIWEPS